VKRKRAKQIGTIDMKKCTAMALMASVALMACAPPPDPNAPMSIRNAARKAQATSGDFPGEIRTTANGTEYQVTKVQVDRFIFAVVESRASIFAIFKTPLGDTIEGVKEVTGCDVPQQISFLRRDGLDVGDKAVIELDC
jgi:hypothetical protein